MEMLIVMWKLASAKIWGNGAFQCSLFTLASDFWKVWSYWFGFENFCMMEDKQGLNWVVSLTIYKY